jgi:hypothetical protein
VDFEAALADRSNPLRVLPAYDSGDHLHPNAAGMQALANAIAWVDAPELPIGAATVPVGGTVPATLAQSIGANEPLRTGAYAKTLVLTLSTTSP